MRIVSLLVALAIATPAAAYVTGTRLQVTQNSNTDFTVEYRSIAKLTDYWCAAGLHVTRTLGMSDRTRVYRLSPPPRRAGQGISFTLDADRSAGETGITTFGGRQDGSMSAGVAVAQYCYTFDVDIF
ncbi:hypothetical protein EI545_14735 [Tabrizicola piscis]|uniref:Uncharacterized protein n=1 Tax=Tabrizicola piscis TaxID=2494374 RepID=A0A3S8U8X2_9RHOB|nr:hypothetical protein [Tabrizicola piscis]AZL59979.1 hypothetical protein EI545_14735 [Tabrizicola piscis]